MPQFQHNGSEYNTGLRRALSSVGWTHELQLHPGLMMMNAVQRNNVYLTPPRESARAPVSTVLNYT